MYAVKETYYTLQGEGAHTGRGAVFCRFAGCNLWTGLERDRATATCTFCDTDFVGTDGPGGGKFSAAGELAGHIRAIWDTHASSGTPYVVFTGGEPMLQLDDALIDRCHALDLEVGIETNGTRPVPTTVDWICVSPKPGDGLVQRHGDELKLVYPQPELTPEQFEDLAFGCFYLQPMDSPNRAENIASATAYCLRRPRWRLSLQTHKMIGIP